MLTPDPDLILKFGVSSAAPQRVSLTQALLNPFERQFPYRPWGEMRTEIFEFQVKTRNNANWLKLKKRLKRISCNPQGPASISARLQGCFRISALDARSQPLWAGLAFSCSDWVQGPATSQSSLPRNGWNVIGRSAKELRAESVPPS